MIVPTPATHEPKRNDIATEMMAISADSRGIAYALAIAITSFAKLGGRSLLRLRLRGLRADEGREESEEEDAMMLSLKIRYEVLTGLVFDLRPIYDYCSPRFPIIRATT